jgi:hypothetical protein
MLIAGTAVLCMAVVLAAPGAIRIPAAIVLVTILPGAALVEALFSRLDDGAERLMLTLGLSLVVTVLLAVLLGVTVGITRESAAIGLAAVSVCAIGARWAAVRAGVAPSGADSRGSGARVRLRTRDLFALGASLALVVAAVIYIRSPLHARGLQGYTALWIAPKGRTVELGVKSQEVSPTPYRLVVSWGSKAVRDLRLTLAPGGTWTTMLPAAPKTQVKALLYRRTNGSWSLYRQVRLAA